jgi:hypothetical protein
MKLPRRQFLHLAAGAAALPAVSQSAWAQAYPARPITIIVPFTAGGATTTLARVLAEHMKTTLGQPILVENVGGASGSIGTTRVARAAPDGYTLSFGNWASHVGSGAMIPLQFDLLKDLEPVAFVANSPLWVVAKKDLTPRDLKEFIAWLKAQSRQGHCGNGRRRQRLAHVRHLHPERDPHQVPVRAISRRCAGGARLGGRSSRLYVRLCGELLAVGAQPPDQALCGDGQGALVRRARGADL